MYYRGFVNYVMLIVNLVVGFLVWHIISFRTALLNCHTCIEMFWMAKLSYHKCKLLLQWHLVILIAEVYVLEYVAGFNYGHLQAFLSQFYLKSVAKIPRISKDDLKEILKLATSRRERECISIQLSEHLDYQKQQHENIMVLKISIKAICWRKSCNL